MALAHEVARAWFDADPLRASLLGVHDRAGELPDLSDAAERAVAERMGGLAAAAGRIDRSALDEVDRVTLNVAGAFAAQTALLCNARRSEWQVTVIALLELHDPDGNLVVLRQDLLTRPVPVQ
jgi:uncharacterized protein (DUF885 family)